MCAVGAAFADMRQELLQKERVSARRRRDLRQPGFFERRPCEGHEELSALLRRERAQRQRRCVSLAPRPRGARVEELRARETKEEDGSVPDPGRQVVDEVDERGLTVMHVLEDQHQRPCPCDLGEESSERPERLFSGNPFLEAERRCHAASDGRAVLELPHELADRARPGRLDDHLADGPVVIPSPYAGQRPTRKVASDSRSGRNSRTSLDFPIPGSPRTVTRWQPD